MILRHMSCVMNEDKDQDEGELTRVREKEEAGLKVAESPISWQARMAGGPLDLP
jgi:hypothetical protein